MKFDYAASQFQLEFGRKFKIVTIRRRVENVEVSTEQRSKYPFTTVRLISLSPIGASPQVVAEATVGCAPTDRFSNEEGRRQALRKLTKLVEGRELRSKIWQTYNERAGKQRPSASAPN